MRELYYGRHGETVDLKNGIRSRPDTPLTPDGQHQARQAGELLLARRILPDLIVCSQLPRAIQSAEAVADEVGYDLERIVRSHLLNERDCGEAVGLPKAEIKRRWPGGFDTVPGAERVEVLQGRAAIAAAWLRDLSEAVVLVMGHGTLGRAIRREFEGRPFTDEYRGERTFGNGEILQLYPQPTRAL